MLKTVTKEQIDNLIKKSEKEVFHRVFGKQCVVIIKLENGFTVVGESACVDSSNYDEKIAYDIAVKSIEKRLWELEGYLLQTRLRGKA
ncbi:Gp49 family protein [Enterococcus sp. AZ177]|uniref:Gp49 family protein n=1 Tax=unclassified Enterococcus TaxID=2608891 RepID=UPI003D3005CE